MEILTPRMFEEWKSGGRDASECKLIRFLSEGPNPLGWKLNNTRMQIHWRDRCGQRKTSQLFFQTCQALQQWVWWGIPPNNQLASNPGRRNPGSRLHLDRTSWNRVLENSLLAVRSLVIQCVSAVVMKCSRLTDSLGPVHADSWSSLGTSVLHSTASILNVSTCQKRDC